MKRILALSILGFILAYYVFTSGLIFEVTKSEATDKLDTPYSIALSNNRTQIVGIYNEDDINCVKWLIYKTDPTIPIYTDYAGASLILDLSDIGRNQYIQPDIKHYIFLTSWNVESGKMMFGWYEGLREYKTIPDLYETYLVYKSGNALVYESKGYGSCK